MYSVAASPGMNEHELRKNPRLDGYVVQNLNEKPDLPSVWQKGKAGLYGYIVLMFDHTLVRRTSDNSSCTHVRELVTSTEPPDQRHLAPRRA